MRAAEFVEGLADQGVRLSVEGGDLKYRGPRAALTPETLDRLKAHKAEVIAHLRHAPEPPPVGSSKVTPEAVKRVMDRPPQWRAGSYIPAYKSGRYSLAGLAYAVTAALGRSAYDAEVVDEVMSILEHLGYGGEVAATWV